MEKEASHLERQHVHNVYEKIAPYFNDKRYKAWPKVQEFLLAQEPGSLVADIGCGNGKYLHINSQTFKIGSDYCFPLAEAARNRNYEVMVCDGLQLPYRDGAFDAVLSIAVIHHFSTKERRIRAIKEMARILRVGGQMMIYVWAMEQKRRKFEKQDLLIPGNKEPQKVSEKRKDLTEPESKNLTLKPLSRVHSNMPTKNRTKHSSFVDEASSPFKIGLHSSRFLTRSLESGLDISSKCASSDQKHGNILRRLYDYCTELRKAANMYPPRLSKPAHFLRQIGDLLPKYIQDLENDTNKVTGLFPLANKSHCTSSNVELGREIIKDLGNVPLPGLKANCNGPVNSMLSLNSDTNCKKDQQVPPTDNTNYLRYYHIFKQNELSDLIQQYIPELLVVSTFYDHSNWCVIAERINFGKCVNSS
ncbi:PREDICTED: probable tRNA methyltransferase 9-like protein [Nanorana parkeri]|uniref:probable tRNA methyltransferase 9-like protein n=1 Tax=Nanorana parkeri TaxID=125878 RepID=UPI00085492A0|nr:PREDICTED: probable tRNA methyltransferase 9-like protein [Nanorana parkeri]